MHRFVVAAILLLSLLPGLALADGEVGVITEVSGEAELLRGDQVLAAEAGVNLMPGDVVRTGDDATAQIDMDDGSSFAMGGKSSLRVREYRMREDHSIIAAAIDDISGWMRFAVAKLRQADYYRFQMPTAVLGVRGTEGVLNVEGEGDNAQSNIMLDKGNVEVAERVENGRLFGNRLQLRDGEYAYRHAGRMLLMRRHFPEQLRQRMPAFVQARLVRRVRFLRRRGIRPRQIEGRLFRMHRRERLQGPEQRRLERRRLMQEDRGRYRRFRRDELR
jgi:FecR protein